jgi:hypothetical protein
VTKHSQSGRERGSKRGEDFIIASDMRTRVWRRETTVTLHEKRNSEKDDNEIR